MVFPGFTTNRGNNLYSMTGTLANAGAILAGGLIGMMIRSRLSPKVTDIVFQGVGLTTLVIGISMALRSDNLILVVTSIVAGSVLGQWLKIDDGLRRFSSYMIHLKGKKNGNTPDRFTEGFITASTLFCVGSMSILGAIEDGMGEVPHLLYTKSIMDGVSSVAFATTFGFSIMLSSIPVLVYQGTLTLFAAFITQYMTEAMINDLTAAGGVLLMGLSLNILRIKEIVVTNMLPSLVIIVILSYFF